MCEKTGEVGKGQTTKAESQAKKLKLYPKGALGSFCKGSDMSNFLFRAINLTLQNIDQKKQSREIMRAIAVS